MHPSSSFSSARSAVLSAVQGLALSAAMLLLPPAASAGSHLVVSDDGYLTNDRLHYTKDDWIGGLCALPGGGLVIYDGKSLVLHGADGSSKVLFTPGDKDLSGTFVRLSPDGQSVYFGTNLASARRDPHLIYRVPLDGSGPVAVDAIHTNYDLTFDDRGRGLVSALDGGENRIYLLDGNPDTDTANFPVVTGIDGYSGPVAFHGGRLYYATAIWGSSNRLVYFTTDQIDRAISEGTPIDYHSLDPSQVVVDGGESYFALAFVGESLFASRTNGFIDRMTPGSDFQPFASIPLDDGTFGFPSYLAFAPGRKDFLSGAGPEGGTLYASISAYPSFNDIVAVTPELYFRRGEVNGDGQIDLSDAIVILGYLFQGRAAPDPLAAADVNDDGRLDLTDPLYLLSFLFMGGKEPPPPFETAGADPTP